MNWISHYVKVTLFGPVFDGCIVTSSTVFEPNAGSQSSHFLHNNWVQLAF